MNRASRLQAAVYFIPNYEGKNLVTGYSKYFAVTKLCAVKELEMLGHSISINYKTELQGAEIQNMRDKEKRKKSKREKELEQQAFEDGDETFAFITGYTSGGAPYGITWEEYSDMNKDARDKSENSDMKKELNEVAKQLFFDDGPL